MTNELSRLRSEAVYTFGDGTEMRFRRVSMQALIEAVEALKQRIVRRAVQALGPDAPADVVASVARQVAQDVERDQRLIDLETPEAVLEILWVCARPLNPDLTREALGERLTIPEMPTLSEFVRRELLGAPESDSPNARAAAAG